MTVRVLREFCRRLGHSLAMPSPSYGETAHPRPPVPAPTPSVRSSRGHSTNGSDLVKYRGFDEHPRHLRIKKGTSLSRGRRRRFSRLQPTTSGAPAPPRFLTCCAWLPASTPLRSTPTPGPSAFAD